MSSLLIHPLALIEVICAISGIAPTSSGKKLETLLMRLDLDENSYTEERSTIMSSTSISKTGCRLSNYPTTSQVCTSFRLSQILIIITPNRKPIQRGPKIPAIERPAAFVHR